MRFADPLDGLPRSGHRVRCADPLADPNPDRIPDEDRGRTQSDRKGKDPRLGNGSIPGREPDGQQRHAEIADRKTRGMAGLLELLIDKGGRDDIYRLADDLAFEIDDLLPIVDAAQLLGFLKIEEGDAAITASGTEFANSEILRQKELFRGAD